MGYGPRLNERSWSAAWCSDAGRPLTAALAWIWGFFALVWTVLASRGVRDRSHDAVLWLGILCLATLRSPFAPQYTGIGTLWLLAMARGIAPEARRHLAVRSST